MKAMKKKKKAGRLYRLLISLLSVAAIIMTSACGAFDNQETNNPSDSEMLITSYQESNKQALTFYEVAPLPEPIISESTWLPPYAYDAFRDFDLVAVCRVTDSREICIEYNAYIPKNEFGTLLSIQIEDIIYQTSDPGSKQAKTASVWHELSSRRTSEDGAGLVSVGKEYLFFLQLASNTASPLDYTAVCDYILRLPKTNGYILEHDALLTNEMVAFLNMQAKKANKTITFSEGSSARLALKAFYQGESNERQ